MNQNRMEEMKKDYNSYPVPEEALERIQAGIIQAKKEESQMRRKGYMRTGKIAGFTAAAAMAAIVFLANSNEHVARAMEQIPVIGAIIQTTREALRRMWMFRRFLMKMWKIRKVCLV